MVDTRRIARVRVPLDVTIGAGEGGVGYTNEQVRDVMAAALVAGSNVTITINDAGDTITIAATGGGGTVEGFPVSEYGTIGSTSGFAAANVAAFQDAIDDADAAGGGTVILPGHALPINAEILIPDQNISIVGQGKNVSMVTATHANARMTFGVVEVTGPSYGHFANWGFDGASTATRGITAYIHNGSLWENIFVKNVSGYPFILSNVQNSVFTAISLSGNKYGGWLTDGCGSNVFTMPQWNANEYWQLKLGNTTNGADAFTHDTTTGYTEPTGNVFITPMFEWIGSPAATANSVACVLVEGSTDNAFLYSRLIAPGGYARPIVKIVKDGVASQATVDFQNATLIGDAAYHTGFDITDGTIRCYAPVSIAGCLVGIDLNGTNAWIEGQSLLRFGSIGSVPTQWTYSGGASRNQVVDVHPSYSFAVGRQWDSGHVRMGAFDQWIDSSSRLRLALGAPSSETDGVVVGGQS